MARARGTFEFTGQSVSIPSSRTKDQTKHPEQTTEAFALSGSSFSISSLLGHRPAWSQHLDFNGGETIANTVATSGSLLFSLTKDSDCSNAAETATQSK